MISRTPKPKRTAPPNPAPIAANPTDLEPLTSSELRTPTRLLLTADEAAIALTISTRTLWTLTNAGQIPCIRLGRCVRYAPEALEEWIREQPN